MSITIFHDCMVFNFDTKMNMFIVYVFDIVLFFQTSSQFCFDYQGKEFKIVWFIVKVFLCLDNVVYRLEINSLISNKRYGQVKLSKKLLLHRYVAFIS